MKPNVIVLTGGLSGSSLLCGLIAQKGYWLGEATKKISYQTFENSQLVELNIHLLHESGYSWDDTMDIPPPSVEKLKQLASSCDKYGYKDFIKKCNSNEPWLWKDPRLCYTIFFWGQFLKLEKCKFILMHRDPKQSWTGIVLRGKTPISFKNMKTVEQNCIEHAKRFLESTKTTYLEMSFEDLMLKPTKAIDGINDYLDIDLNLDELTDNYNGKLYRLRWSNKDLFKAYLRFLYYRIIKRDVTIFPRKHSGHGSGWAHLN